MEELHAKWRARAVAAAQRYAAATVSTNKVIRERMDLSRPEGSKAVEEALRIENLARQKYREALDVFSRLVLDGVEPPDGV